MIKDYLCGLSQTTALKKCKQLRRSHIYFNGSLGNLRKFIDQTHAEDYYVGNKERKHPHSLRGSCRNVF